MNSLYPSSFIKKYLTPSVNPLLLPTTNDLTKREIVGYGVGIYALRHYERGECIGHFIAKPSQGLRQHSLQCAPDSHLEDLYFVGYLLHSCDPSVVVDMHQQKVFCLKDIHAGEALFMDYASTEDILYQQFACACGAPNCRHWITGRNESVNAVGRQYLEQMQSESLLLNTAIYETRTTEQNGKSRV